jgi:hypothetical protein
MQLPQGWRPSHLTLRLVHSRHERLTLRAVPLLPPLPWFFVGLLLAAAASPGDAEDAIDGGRR